MMKLFLWRLYSMWVSW